MDVAAQDRQLAAELLLTISHLRRSLRHHRRDRQRDEPLSGSQGELMAVVGANPGVTVNDAAVSLHLAANTVSTVVSQLVRLGLVERCADPDDARLTRLRLTAAGRARRAAARDYREQALACAVTQLTAGERAAVAAAVPAIRSLTAWIDTDEPVRAGAARARQG